MSLFPGCPGVEMPGYAQPYLWDEKVEILCAIDWKERGRPWRAARLEGHSA